MEYNLFRDVEICFQKTRSNEDIKIRMPPLCSTYVCTYTYNNICQPLWRFIFVRKSKKLDPPSAQLKGFNYTRVYFNRITIAKRDEGEKERIEKQQDNSLCVSFTEKSVKFNWGSSCNGLVTTYLKWSRGQFVSQCDTIVMSLLVLHTGIIF